MDEVEKDDVVLRSMDLDMSFVEERGKGVIEENEVEKSFNDITEEKIRKEENRKETRADESNFETLD